MTKEQLKALGLTDEQIGEVFRLHGLVLNPVKTKLETKETEVETLQGQVKTANETIQDFKKLDLEGIKQEADDYKEKYEQAETKRKEELAALEFNHKLDLAIKDSKAKNVKAVKALLDIDELKESKNQEEDIKKALEAQVEENGFLFEVEEVVQGTGGSKGNTGKDQSTPKEENYGKLVAGGKKKEEVDISRYQL